MMKLFIINTITFWNEPPRARHQLAYALAKKYKVVFISANNIGLPGFKKIVKNENLDFIVPRFPIDLRIRIRLPWINSIYQKWLFKKIKKDYPDCTVINFDFTAKHISSFFDNYVYYCNDDHISISKRDNPKWIANYQEDCEKKVAENARFCVGTSAYLKNTLSKYNNKSFEIRLGAPKIDGLNNYYPNLNSSKEKINVGLVGYIKSIDKGVIEQLLDCEDIMLTLVGPIDSKTRAKYEILPNVNVTGSLFEDKLYKEVNNFDVGLIPYSLKSTVDRTPNKLWLYLALGKPVVISDIPGIKNWKFPEKFIYRSSNNSDFIKHIRNSVREDSETTAIERMKFSQKNTWDDRCDQFIEIHSSI